VTGTAISLTGVRKMFGDTPAVRDLTTDITAGSFTALLGPSGCGKSTTLAMIGGLLDPDSGDVRFDGRSQLGVPAERRPAGLVFQKPLLFPHLNVEQNVAFGLRMRRLDRANTRDRVTSILDRVQLGAMAKRRVGELSGGQEQRVALARALVLEPQVLLLDEPFSALDALTRLTAQALVGDLWALHQCAVLLVTHDVEESVKLADRVLVMKDGVIAHQARVDLPRPRAVTNPRFVALRAELLGHLGVEVG